MYKSVEAVFTRQFDSQAGIISFFQQAESCPVVAVRSPRSFVGSIVPWEALRQIRQAGDSEIPIHTAGTAEDTFYVSTNLGNTLTS